MLSEELGGWRGTDDFMSRTCAVALWMARQRSGVRRLDCALVRRGTRLWIRGQQSAPRLGGESVRPGCGTPRPSRHAPGPEGRRSIAWAAGPGRRVLAACPAPRRDARRRFGECNGPRSADAAYGGIQSGVEPPHSRARAADGPRYPKRVTGGRPVAPRPADANSGGIQSSAQRPSHRGGAERIEGDDFIMCGRF
jgi:hypothetical protein